MATLGGLLIGAACALLWVLNGRVAGVSGVLGRLLERDSGELSWRFAFLAGLLIAGGGYVFFAPSQIQHAAAASPLVLVGAGLLVGIGTSLANGCTSGHGVVGLARLSKRSAVATVTFIGAAALTVFVTHHVLGGLP